MVTAQVEPDWLRLQQLSLPDFYAGLRQRNWTCSAFRPESPPWRVQLFSCDYL